MKYSFAAPLRVAADWWDIKIWWSLEGGGSIFFVLKTSPTTSNTFNYHVWLNCRGERNSPRIPPLHSIHLIWYLIIFITGCTNDDDATVGKCNANYTSFIFLIGRRRIIITKNSSRGRSFVIHLTERNSSQKNSGCCMVACPSYQIALFKTAEIGLRDLWSQVVLPAWEVEWPDMCLSKNLVPVNDEPQHILFYGLYSRVHNLGIENSQWLDWIHDVICKMEYSSWVIEEGPFNSRIKLHSFFIVRQGNPPPLWWFGFVVTICFSALPEDGKPLCSVDLLQLQPHEGGGSIAQIIWEDSPKQWISSP